jgi:glycosyltransferase 2 family protein
MTSRLGAALWVKAAISGAVLIVVLLRVDLSAVTAALARVDWVLLLVALGLTVPLGFTGIQRWRSVAATFGEDLPISKAFIYTWIGQFINLGFPSLLGLDSVRAWKMHEQGITLGLATRIVVVDRLNSLLTLLMVIAVALPYLWTLKGNELFRQSATLAFALGCAALAGLSTAAWIGRADYARSLLKHLRQLAKDFNHSLFGNTAITLNTSVWGILNHLGRVAIVFCLARALGLAVSAFDTFTLVPSALLIAMVPITLAGWGVREVVFIQAFSLAGVASSDALALSLLYGIVFLVTGLLGGAVWFAERRQQRQGINTPPAKRHA